MWVVKSTKLNPPRQQIMTVSTRRRGHCRSPRELDWLILEGGVIRLCCWYLFVSNVRSFTFVYSNVPFHFSHSFANFRRSSSIRYSSRSLTDKVNISRWTATWKGFPDTNTPNWNIRLLVNLDPDPPLQLEHHCSVFVGYVISSFEYVSSSPPLFSCSPLSTVFATPLSWPRAF